MPVALERQTLGPRIRAVILDQHRAVLDLLDFPRDRRMDVRMEERIRRRDALPALHNVARLHARLARRADVLRQRNRHDTRRRHRLDGGVPRELLALGVPDASARMNPAEKPMEHNITPTEYNYECKHELFNAQSFAFVFILH